jgi:hypothetical protein
MVGTSAVIAFFALILSRARRSAGTVRTIIGFRDIWARSQWGREATGAELFGGMPDLYQGRYFAAKWADADFIRQP